jgi:ligand-binding SRPBCC domain-containing protein
MIRFEVSTEIKRPLGEVFAYADDPTNLAEWNSIVEESKASETPVRKGTKITTRARFLGRRVDSIAEVTEHVPNQKFVQMSDKPFPLTITNQFEAAGEGTRVTAILEGEPGGFFRIGEPVLVRIAKKQFQAQLDTMKELLEARAPAEVK